MRYPLVRAMVGSAMLSALPLGVTWAAEPTRSTPSTTKSSTIPAAKSSSATRGGSARGPLPDPILLDGSTHPPEKRPEHGMVGDFELPGDENARNNRVGGPQMPAPPQGGGLPSPVPAAGLPSAGMPSASAPGASIPQIPDPLAQQGQGGGGPQNPSAAGNPVNGAGQQGAQPQGGQVGQLTGEGGGPEQGEIGEKPQQVSLGDSAMQIKTIGNPAAVVGGTQQQAGQTQQHEKTPGTGGKGAAGNNSNRGSERGRAMPAGL